ncbi:hypothetical protein JQ604_34475 [Bradyrhizobium jicamae]|uniref:hypothetical protein n=1 Tax=Bradyrhizobium jicamae TaxID=280332 RepID=UPI001BA618D7|nr:hypothetical protein [Bradyrhizobium jicamae]MBR0757314.1 hypothetical protein [Bradyrhizobium jicamae]
MRVFFAEVEGNNESVQEALKTMVSAMNRPTRVIQDQRSNGKTAVLLEQTEGDEVEAEEALDQEEFEFDAESTPSNTRKVRGTGKKIDRNAGLNLVPNLDFRPSGKQALREFVEEKNPKNDLEAVLAAAYYMQHQMDLTKIGPAHVMTAFKEVGRAIPVDLRQTLRNVKKSKMWLNFTDIEDFRTTTQGDNFVEHEMGKSE